MIAVAVRANDALLCSNHSAKRGAIFAARRDGAISGALKSKSAARILTLTALLHRFRFPLISRVSYSRFMPPEATGFAISLQATPLPTDFDAAGQNGAPPPLGTHDTY